MAWPNGKASDYDSIRYQEIAGSTPAVASFFCIFDLFVVFAVNFFFLLFQQDLVYIYYSHALTMHGFLRPYLMTAVGAAPSAPIQKVRSGKSIPTRRIAYK